MSFQFNDLDRTTRRHMRAEFYMDLESGIPLPGRLNASGRIMFPVALESAIEKGDAETLSAALREGGFVREWEEGLTRAGKTIYKHVPWNAADTIAEEAFNRYYMRGVCRRAVEEGIESVVYYQAHASTKFRAEVDARVGTQVEARRFLGDLRAFRHDPEPTTRAGTGLSVCLHRTTGALAIVETEEETAEMPDDMPAKCQHPSDNVVADINQGDAVWGCGKRDEVYKTQWCRNCGAYRHYLRDEDGDPTKPIYTEWRAPGPNA